MQAEGAWEPSVNNLFPTFRRILITLRVGGGTHSARLPRYQSDEIENIKYFISLSENRTINLLRL